MWRGRFPQSLARTQFSPAQGAAFQRAGSLRPGQAGAILIGAVRPAHIAATFADLAGRGYLRIEETAGAEPDWLITRVRTASGLLAGQGLLRYEKTLLRRLFRRADHVLLSQLSGMAYGDCLPYAIAFQLMPEWGERFAGLRPPDTPAPGGWHLAPGSAGFLSGFTNAGVAGAFTAAVCSHAPPASTFSHHGGSGYGHGGGFGGHGGYGGHGGGHG
jgi:hypothetical protein